MSPVKFKKKAYPPMYLYTRALLEKEPVDDPIRRVSPGTVMWEQDSLHPRT
jgi:hypothetical protein